MKKSIQKLGARSRLSTELLRDRIFDSVRGAQSLRIFTPRMKQPCHLGGLFFILEKNSAIALLNEDKALELMEKMGFLTLSYPWRAFYKDMSYGVNDCG